MLSVSVRGRKGRYGDLASSFAICFLSNKAEALDAFVLAQTLFHRFQTAACTTDRTELVGSCILRKAPRPRCRLFDDG